MTLELPPELETQIERAARQQSMDAAAFAIQTLRRAVSPEPAIEETKQKQTRSFGFLRDQIPGSDAFLEERHAEAKREMQKEQRA